MLGPISDRACVLADSETGQANVMKVMLVGLAGWINQQQQDGIDYLREVNRIIEPEFGSAEEWKGAAASGLGASLRRTERGERGVLSCPAGLFPCFKTAGRLAYAQW